jgi:hypothetical protein
LTIEQVTGMDLINSFLGNDQKRSQYEDFVGRYEQGSPYDGIRDDEALERYREVSPRLSQTDYEDSAEAAFSRLSPQERRQFGEYMRSRAQQQGITDFDGDGVDDRMQGPRELARMTSQVRQRDPNILEQLMGQGGTGGSFDNPIAKAAFAGIAAMAASKLMGRR